MSGEDAFIRFSETLTSHMRFRAVEQSVDLEEKRLFTKANSPNTSLHILRDEYASRFLGKFKGTY